MREFIQEKLEEIQDIETTPEIPDEMLEQNKTYFSFTLEENFLGSDFSKNYDYQVILVGFVKRKNDDTENTLDIIDKSSRKICSKLKEINFKSSYKDVSSLDGIKKIMITAKAKYNEINYEIM